MQPEAHLATDADERLLQALEAMIFASDDPVPASELAAAFADVTGHELTEDQVTEAVEALNVGYQDARRAVRIEAWGGGFRHATVEEVAPFIRALAEDPRQRRMSRALIETLAVVAYKQPVTKSEIDFVRGVDADYALRRLIEREFVTILGRADAVGRPLLFGTTDHFLDRFGLQGLDALPRPREIEELLTDPAFAHERATLLEAQAALAPEAASDTETSLGEPRALQHAEEAPVVREESEERHAEPTPDEGP